MLDVHWHLSARPWPPFAGEPYQALGAKSVSYIERKSVFVPRRALLPLFNLLNL